MRKRRNWKAVVAERGQVTIPKVIRDQLGIHPGAVLNFDLDKGKIIVTKELVGDPIANVFGCLKGVTPYTSTDAYIKEVRGADA